MVNVGRRREARRPISSHPPRGAKSAHRRGDGGRSRWGTGGRVAADHEADPSTFSRAALNRSACSAVMR